MAFNILNFAPIGAASRRFTEMGKPGAPSFFSYATNDTMEDVNTAGYFNSIFQMLSPYDTIRALVDADGTPDIVEFIVLTSSVNNVDVSDGISILTGGGGSPSTPYVYQTPGKLFFVGGTKSVSEWTKSAGFGPSLRQSTALAQPDLASDVYTFDGLDHYLADQNSDTTDAPTSVATIPDGSGEIATKGFAITGLSKNLRTNELICGNHGGASPHSDTTLQQSVVTLSADGTTKVRENILGLGDNFSVQDVQYDNETNTYWCCIADISGTTRTVRNYPLTATSDADLLSSFAVPDNSNGLTINPNNDELYVLVTGTRIVRRYNKSGTYLGDLCTLPSSSSLDMLTYDPVYNILYYSKGGNGSPGTIQGYSLDRDSDGDALTITDSLAIEGFVISNDGLTIEAVANDAFYHNGGSEINNISFYDYDLSQQVAKLYKAYDDIEFGFVGRLLADNSSTEVIWGVGDPVSSLGFSIYKKASTTDEIRVIVHNGTSLEAVDLTLGAAWTTESIIQIVIDVAGKEIKAYQNGVLQDTQSWVLAYTEMIYTACGLCGNFDGSEGSAGSRHVDMELKDMYIAFDALTVAEANAYGNAWATEHSLSYTDRT